MVRVLIVIWCGIFLASCHPFEDTHDVHELTAELAGRCVRTRQILGIYDSGGHPVSKFFLDTNDINATPVQVLPTGTELIIRRVVYHSSFEHSEAVVIGDVGGRPNVIVSRIFTDDSLQELRRSVRDRRSVTQIVALRLSVAGWCR